MNFFAFTFSIPARPSAHSSPFPSSYAFRHRLLVKSLWVALGVVPAAVRAQSEPATLPTVVVTDSTPEANGRLNLDTPSSTASRLGLTPRETPATVTVVDRATIEARGRRIRRRSCVRFPASPPTTRPATSA